VRLMASNPLKRFARQREGDFNWQKERHGLGLL
jgi:hypothetical protein